MPVGVVVGGRLPEVAQQPTKSGVYGRMNDSTGSDLFSAWIESLKVGVATLASVGALLSRSVRSFVLPGWRSSVASCATVGLDSVSSGSSSRRNGARFFVAGLAAATILSKSPSRLRRSTNVELARRKVPGRYCRAWLSATFSLAIAPRLVFVFDTSSVSVLLFAPSARMTLPVLRTSAVSAGLSAASCVARRRVAASDGEK